MQIRIIAVGKLKETYLKDGIAEYVKRLGPYAKVELLEVPDEKAPENLSEAEGEKVKEKEGERILKLLKEGEKLVLLDLVGKAWTSEAFAAQLEKWGVEGASQVAFVIGGSLGVSEELRRRADVRWSLSPLTFPHQLVRLLVAEQVYRAFKIIRGETYHK